MAFNLYFRGQLAEGVSSSDAAKRLSKLVKQPPEVVEKRLFTGQDVKVTSAATRDAAEKLRRAFEKAGVVLDIQESSRPNEGPSASEPRKQGGSGRKWVYLATAATLILAIGAVAAWYTQPVWRGGHTSALQRTASHALAGDGLVALVHLDVDRIVALQTRLAGPPDADALVGPGDDRFTRLARAGISFRDRVDDVLMALHTDDGEPYWSMVVMGALPPDAVPLVLTENFEIERRDNETGTIFFTWLDEATCEPSELHAARILDSYVLVAAADRIEALADRIAQNSVSGVAGFDEWMRQAEEQLLTVGIFMPASVADAADGMAAMVLAAAGEAAAPAEGVFFGAKPTLAPPGVEFSAAVLSEDAAFLDQANAAASGWLAMAKMGAEADSPELLPIYERISVERAGNRFRGAVQLDTDIGGEIEKLGSALFSNAFGSSMGSSGASFGPGEEQLDESPLQFANASAANLQPYDAFGDSFSKPLWRDGSFGMSISRVHVGEDGGLRVELKTEGRGLPNLGDRSQLVRMQVTGVDTDDGRSLLSDKECGPTRNTGWTDRAMVMNASRFVDNELVYYPTVTIDKQLDLGEVGAEEIAAIRGEIEFQLPAEISTVRVDAPFDSRAVETDAVRVKFRDAAANSLSFQTSGDTRRILDVRGLNASGQVLESGSSMSSGVWFGSGENVSTEFYGTVAAAEVVLAERFEPISYQFELPGALPRIESDFERNVPATMISPPDAVSAALAASAPAVTFDYSEPAGTTTAGPAFVALDRIQANAFMGLHAQFEVYVDAGLPLDNQLSGASIVIDRAEFADGSTLDLGLSAPLSLRPDGGYWLNGEFQYNEDRPWLKSSASFQVLDYEGDAPVAVHGRIVFRGIDETLDAELSAQPGASFAAEGVALRVSEWRPNSLTVGIASGADRLVSLTALTDDGTVAGAGLDIVRAGDGQQVVVDLGSSPSTLAVKIAKSARTFERPFALTLDD